MTSSITSVKYQASHAIKQSAHKALCFLLVFGLLAFAPTFAFADVRKSDVIYGQSIDSRGLDATQCPSIDAERSIVIDSEGTVYFERNADEACQIASITKVMTAVVAMDAVTNGIVSLDDTVSVSADAAAIGESTAGLAEGDTMSLQTALYALLVPSGNDAAVAISDLVGKALSGSDDTATAEAAFVNEMNTKAQNLGCADTVYENPHGLDFDDYAGNLHSTARDQAKVIACAMNYELIRQIVSGGSTTISVNRADEPTDIYLETTDGFLDIYTYAIGVKTGYTQLAGSSFSAAANNGEIELYALVLNSSDDYQRFYDAETLMEWTYEHITDYTFINSSQTATYEGEEVPVVAEVAHKGWIDKTIPVTIENPDVTMKVFDLNGNVSQSVEFNEPEGNVKAGDVLGTISFKQRNEVIVSFNLIACEDFDAPGFIDGIGIWWQRFLANFSGASSQAESYVVNEVPLVVDKSQM